MRMKPFPSAGHAPQRARGADPKCSFGDFVALQRGFLVTDEKMETSRPRVYAAGDARVHAFADMHDLGDMLVAAGFAEPVMDMERLTFLYPDGATLLADPYFDLAPPKSTGRERFGAAFAERVIARICAVDADPFLRDFLLALLEFQRRERRLERRLLRALLAVVAVRNRARFFRRAAFRAGRNSR